VENHPPRLSDRPLHYRGWGDCLPLHPDEQPTLTGDELVDMLERDAEHS